ncbi:MAG: VWA domain-containing protein [Nostocales cyanobacterium]|nr:MAG: VWA domain-containing protein [Nostocales cyanobacterium]
MMILTTLANPSLAENKIAEIVGNPQVTKNKVTVRIKVKTKDDRPIMGLQDTDFKLTVDKKEITFKSQDWKSPEETTPPPAYILVLLDMSGSMNQRDSRGSKKITGAIRAIRKFTEISSERGGKTHISIVPFGETSSRCRQGYPINKNTLDNFLLASDFKLQNYLEYLDSLRPCASTNLYEPLTKAIRFLGNTNDTRFYLPEDSPEPKPRLSIILLSDGYHNKPNEARDFNTLKTLLQRNNNITVHTLGYGLTQAQLGNKYKLGRPATRADIGTGENKVPAEEFVEDDKLAEIAKITGGIGEFSPDAESVSESLQLFLNALLGEYEITYTEPNPERGSQHFVQVEVNSPDGTQVKSKPKSYRIGVFGWPLPLGIRLIMFLLVLVMMSFGGILPFYYWGKHLKEDALRD